MTATEVTELDAAAHTIKNVTVYKAGKADIVRTFSVDLEVNATLSCKFLQVPLTCAHCIHLQISIDWTEHNRNLPPL